VAQDAQPTPRKSRGGRPRKHKNHAARQAAYEERKQLNEAIAAGRYLKEETSESVPLVSGGYDAAKMAKIEGAKFREAQLGPAPNEPIDYTHKHSASPRKRVAPKGYGPASEDIEPNLSKEKQGHETDNTHTDKRASHKKLMAKGDPLSTSDFVKSIKRAFCPTHSPVQPGRIPQGADFISGSPVLMFAATYNPLTGKFQMACGCERSLPHRKKRKSAVEVAS